MMTPLNRAELDYYEGVRSFKEFLNNPNVISWAKAFNLLQNAISLTVLERGKAANANYKIGLLFLFDSDYRNALHFFEKCLSTKREAYIYEAIGAVHSALYQHEQSAWCYRQALELGGSAALGYIGLGRALLQLGRTEEAIGCFVESSCQGSSPAHFWMGSAYRQSGEVDRAIESYLGALAAGQEEADACQALAEIYLEEKDDPAASLDWFDRMYTLPESTSAKGLCRTRTPFAAYFCERYPNGSMRARVFEVLCGLRREVVGVKEYLCCDGDGAAIHYTSVDTAKALVLDMSPFRLHRANMMNDPSEGAVLQTAIGDDLVAELQHLSGSDEWPSAFVGSFVLRPEGAPSVGVPADDNLLHWRLYGKTDGVEGRGACLSYLCNLFSRNSNRHETPSVYHSAGLLSAPSILRQLARWQAVPPQLYRVAYEGDGADELVAGIRPHLHRLRDLKHALSTDVERAVISNCVVALLEEIRFLFKSRNFEYEKEARVVVMVWPDEKRIETNLRSGRPYIELGQDMYPAEVVLGPSVSRNPFTEVEVNGSGVNVRKSRVRYAPQGA